MHTRRTPVFSLTLALVVAAGFLVTGTARAQTQTGAKSSFLEEVIVTAQRREQALGDVPVAVTALSATTLQARGILSYEDYLRTVPGASFADMGNQSNEVKIRGVGNGTAQLSPTTAVYLGEVPVIHTGRGLNSSYNFYLADMARVEVLRGPQGQLFGSNSLGGAIRNIPNKPQFDGFHAIGSGTYSNTTGGGDNWNGDLTLNMPLGDTFAVRVTGYGVKESGWYDNIYAGGPTLGSLAQFAPPFFQPTFMGHPVGPRVGAPWGVLPPAVLVLPLPVETGVPGGPPVAVYPGILGLNPGAAAYAAPSNVHKNVNESKLKGARLMGTWNVSDTFSADLMVAYEHKENDGTSWAQEVPNVPGPYPGTFIVPRVAGSAVPQLYSSSARDYQQVNMTDAGNKDEIFLANLLLNWTFDFATLTSSSSYWDRTETLDTDLGVLAFPTTGVSSTFPSVVSRKDNPHTYIQEFRLTSNTDGRLTWLAGLFLQKLDQDYRVDVTDLSGQNILFLDRTVRSLVFGTRPPPTGPAGLQQGTFVDKQYAVFGQIGYDLTDQWNVAFSFRWFKLKQESELINSGFFFATQGNSYRKHSSDKFTPKVNVSFKPNDNSLFYLTAAEGYRTGITNRDLPLDLCSQELANAGYPDGVPPTKPDTLWNYELGAKLAFAENRVNVNAAVYHIDWSDLQGQVFLSALKDPNAVASQCTFETIFNVGDAKIDGGELELSMLLTDRLKLDASVSYTNPEYKDNYPEIGIFKGTTIEGTADWQSFVSLQWDFNLTRYDSFARFEWAYLGKIKPRPTDFTLQPLTYPIGDYSTLNLRLGLGLTKNVRLDVWVNNLTDKFGVTRAIDLAGDGVPTYFTIRPRTIGATLRFNF